MSLLSPNMAISERKGQG